MKWFFSQKKQHSSAVAQAIERKLCGILVGQNPFHWSKYHEPNRKRINSTHVRKVFSSLSHTYIVKETRSKWKFSAKTLRQGRLIFSTTNQNLYKLIRVKFQSVFMKWHFDHMRKMELQRRRKMDHWQKYSDRRFSAHHCCGNEAPIIVRNQK